MKYCIIVIMTIIAWQLICVLADIISKDNEDVVRVFAFGVFIPIAMTIKFILGKIILIYYKLNYNQYLFFHDGKRDAICYMTPKYAKEFNQDINKHYYVQLIRYGKSFKSIPYKGNVVKDGNNPCGFTFDYLNRYKESGDENYE